MQFGKIRISQPMAVTVAALAVVAIAAVAFNAALDGDDSGGDGTRCSLASGAARRIEEGLTVDGAGSLSGAYAVRSRDFESIWFVAAEIDGPGLEEAGDVGVWTTNDLQGGLIFSVNGLAREFSDWGDGRSTDADFSMSNDGAEEARRCVS